MNFYTGHKRSTPEGLHDSDRKKGWTNKPTNTYSLAFDFGLFFVGIEVRSAFFTRGLSGNQKKLVDGELGLAFVTVETFAMIPFVLVAHKALTSTDFESTDGASGLIANLA